MSSYFARKYVQNRIKRRQAEVDGSAVLGLLIVGGLFFAGHAVTTQLGNIQVKIKDACASLAHRGKTVLASDEGQHIAEDMSNAMALEKRQKERD